MFISVSFTFTYPSGLLYRAPAKGELGLGALFPVQCISLVS